MSVILCADAGPEIGWGHAVRQLALAQALVEIGGRPTFLTRTREALRLDWPCPVRLVDAVDPRAGTVMDLPEPPDTTAPDRVVWFDDYGHAPDVLGVDPHFGAHLRRTSGFLGPQWAPVRKGFAECGDSEGQAWTPRSGVYVYGPHPELPKGLEPVTAPSFRTWDVARAMVGAVCALVPPSMVALECLAVGTPVVLYVPGPKWQPIADAMVEAGVARVWSGEKDDHTLACVLADDGLRGRMSEAGRDHVDGRGAQRLARWLA